MFENDYIMRMIHEMIRAVIKLLTGCDTDIEEVLTQRDVTEDNDFQTLIRLVRLGRINEAENRLYELMEADAHKNLKTALLFYDYLNNLDDETLLAGGFSRDEIADGLKTVMNTCGYGALAGTFLL